MSKRHHSILTSLSLTLWVAGCIPGVDGGPVTQSEPPQARPPMGPGPTFDSVPRSASPAPPPLSGGTLRALADNRTAVASDPDLDRIFVVDYRAKKILAEVKLNPQDEPGRVIEDADGFVHVALRRAGALVTLSPKTWEVAARRPVCQAPRGIAYEARTKLVHVACAEGELVSLPAAPDGGVVRRVQLERDLRDIVVDGDVLLVSQFRSAKVLVVDGSGKLVSSALGPVERKTQQFRGGPRPSNSSSRSSSDQSVTGEAILGTMVPSVAWRLIPYRPGQALMVHQRALADEVSVESGGYAGAKCGGIVETSVTDVGPLAAARPTPAISGAVLAIDIAVSPDRARIALVSAGNQRQPMGSPFAQVQIARVDVVLGQGECTFLGGENFGPKVAVPTRFDAGVPPQDPPADDGFPEDPIEFRPQLEGDAIAVAFNTKGHLLVQTREPAGIEVLTAPNLRITLSNDRRTDTGHQIFHTNSGAGLACASCHPEGGDDGRVWKFAQKDGKVAARRTQNLRGGITATAPFHWDGSLKTLGHLMDEVFVSRMQGPKLSNDFVNTLGKWMDTVPALPRSEAKDPIAAERGRTLFFNAEIGCAKCHMGSLLTDNKTVDVGTGQALQVPSLRGLGWRAPFMHDGCARTLGDRITNPACGGGDKHGITSKLTAAQVADLVGFMDTL